MENRENPAGFCYPARKEYTMDWLDRMNLALVYIENNLTGTVDYYLAAKEACCSAYHFSRMFSSVTGIPLSEYVRRRRLTLAAFDLQNTGMKVIDIAMKYGYDSPDAFSRAFKNLHGMNPTDARKKGAMLKAYPKISFQIQIKGDIEMEYRIEELDFNLTIAGKRERIRTKEGFTIVPRLWQEATQSGFLQRLIDMSWEKPQCKLESLLGVCGDVPSITADEFDYFMGVRYDGTVPDDMETMTVAASTWAVFPGTAEAWKRLYTEWIPTSGYILADLPCIECFYAPGHVPTDELWVSVKRK
jgi:AraC family transcriptional regulator